MKKTTAFNALCCAVTLLLGMYLAAYQGAFPQIKTFYNVSEAASGLVIALHFWGSLLFPPVVGYLSDRLGKKPVLLCSFGFLCFSLAAMLIFHNEWILFVSIPLIGGCFASIEGGVSGLLVTTNPHSADRMVNLSQMTFCFGAVIGPLLLNVFEAGFLGLYPVFLLLFLLCAAGYAFTAPGFFLSGPPDPTARAGRSLLTGSLVLPLSLTAMIVYVGVEEGLAFFGGNLPALEGTPDGVLRTMISAYWLGMALSRLIFSRVKKRLFRGMMVSLLLGCLFAAVLPALRGVWGAVSFYFFLGAALGPIWAYIMVFATLRFPSAVGTVSSLMVSAGALGGALTPILLGEIEQRWGPGWIFVALLSFMIVLVLLLLFLNPRRGAFQMGRTEINHGENDGA